ncbi:MAG: Gifsy prophage protein [Proteobacteria bacterium]|nr:Gifsy prophage protein [Pseudomonadota bacterium]
MKRIVLAAAAALIAGVASAAMPVFVATCPTGINVDAGRDGVVRINGQKAKVKKLNDNAFDAKAGYITISVGANPGAAPDVFYTGKGKANGVCTVTGFEASKGAAAEPARQPAAGASSSASGSIPCAQAKGQPMGQCPFTVSREGQGTAIVTVTRPDGRTRAIFFEKGKATGADLSQADGNMTFKASKKGDLFKIQAGKERYEIPEAVVFGG